ncbi:ribonuclease toxin immunity protein CdiI [Paenibacillus guangzhouensis]|uniref:ribonuclease toxin immunity protein CdiI n=1 Tax=Paenibacillus guangzhouensis TaxID=1473112 RepID=UPI001266B555|nr:ribonuclease toxin immunity protein CdiI [Paenibacillus guangzhouensis]
MDNSKENYQLIVDSFKMKGLNKDFIITVLARFVLDFDFMKILTGFLNENVLRRDTIGVVYSDEFEIGDEGYFGENKVLFYYGIDDNWHDIVSYDELCDYLQVACEIYMDKNKTETEEIKRIFNQIKEKYEIVQDK